VDVLIGAIERRRKPRRQRRSHRVDWDRVYSRLPKGTFAAADVRRLVPGVGGGTVSQGLTAWVKARKLRRTGA
jgi:hypothetical protein